MIRGIMKDRFYLACFRDNVGGNVAFHKYDGCGYVTDLREAGVLTREQAQRAWDLGREYDQPMSADHVDANIIWKVDHQYLQPQKSISSEKLYFAYKEGSFSGNDLYWINGFRGGTLDVNKAFTFNAEHASHVALCPDVSIALADDVEKVKRPTFEYSKFNKRTMVQGAGLKTPESIKRTRSRRPSGKVMLNCPSCGRIKWQYDPHEFHGCQNVYCELWSAHA